MASFDIFNPLVFSPMSLSPALWLDVMDGSTLYQDRNGASSTILVASDADPVGSWLDKSGNGRHMTAPSDAARPTFKTAITNGKNGLLFDNGDDSIVTASAYNQSTNTIFCVLNPLTDSSYYLFTDNSSPSSIYQLLKAVSGDNRGISSFAGAPSVYKNGSTFSQNTQNSLYTSLTNQTSIITITGADFSTWTVGFRISGQTSFFYGGQLNELIIYSSALSASQKQSVEKYLANKWKITLS